MTETSREREREDRENQRENEETKNEDRKTKKKDQTKRGRNRGESAPSNLTSSSPPSQPFVSPTFFYGLFRRVGEVVF